MNASLFLMSTFDNKNEMESLNASNLSKIPCSL